MESQKIKIQVHYDSNPEREWSRLDQYGIEYQVILRHLKSILKPHSTILDVGGGPGRYAFALTNEGHKVHLTDLSSGHIELSKKKEIELGIKLESSNVVDAEDLSKYDSNSFDAVINFGPLYHLQSHDQRMNTITESLRVSKKGGICAFGFLSIYAPIFDVVKKDPILIKDRYNDLIKFIDTGIHVESKNEPGFTDIFLIDPMKIEELFKDLSTKKIVLFGSEGLTAQSENILNKLDDECFNSWVDLAYTTSSTLAGINCSEHIIYIVEKR